MVYLISHMNRLNDQVKNATSERAKITALPENQDHGSFSQAEFMIPWLNDNSKRHLIYIIDPQGEREILSNQRWQRRAWKAIIKAIPSF